MNGIAAALKSEIGQAQKSVEFIGRKADFGNDQIEDTIRESGLARCRRKLLLIAHDIASPQ